jgi:hypothetical protein
MTWSVVLGAVLLASAASASEPQAGLPAAGRAFGLGFGLGSGSFSVGDETNRDFSASIVGRIGLDCRNRFLLMAELYPVGVTNPVADETARSFGLLVGLNLGDRVKLRPSLGWAFNSWSGSQKLENTSSGPLFGLDIGPEFRVNPRLTLSAEAVLRYTGIEIEGNVRGGIMGVQLVAAWRGSGP